VVGLIRKNGGNFQAVYWKNGTLVPLTDGTQYANVYKIIASGTDIYITGCEGPVAKYWKNGKPVNLNDGSKVNAATSIAISGSDIYVSGFESDGINIAKYWKNGVPVNLTDGIKYATTTCIVVYGPDVYVTGAEQSSPYSIISGASKYVAIYWKNGKAIKLTDGTNNAWANSIQVTP
jgi:hypothetical protein